MPVNDAETKLRHLLLAAGFGEGIRGEQIRLSSALGSTTPDVIYRAEDHEPDEGVCVYLDGLSAHLHGNPETAEQDREIRTWLRNSGYDVIEIAATDLDDQDAMTRHFRRLAQYLGMRGTRTGCGMTRRGSTALASPSRKHAVGCAWCHLQPISSTSPAYLWFPCTWPRASSATPTPSRRCRARVGGAGHVADPSPRDVRRPRGRKVDGAAHPRRLLLSVRWSGDRQPGGPNRPREDAERSRPGHRPAVHREAYRSEKATNEDGWRHLAIVLEPLNPDYEPIELIAEDESPVRVDRRADRGYRHRGADRRSRRPPMRRNTINPHGKEP